MAKINNQDLKDGQAYERALEAIGVQRIYTLKVVHYWYPDKGKTLCQCKGNLYREPQVNKPLECGRCLNKLAKLLEAALKEEARTYWLKKCERGVLRADAPKPEKKAVPAYERLELPEEYLPTGTGKGKGLF